MSPSPAILSVLLPSCSNSIAWSECLVPKAHGLYPCSYKTDPKRYEETARSWTHKCAFHQLSDHCHELIPSLTLSLTIAQVLCHP